MLPGPHSCLRSPKQIFQQWSCEQVAGFVHYHNTITIPNDENWIVQGIVDPASGLPSSLNGRLKSGSAVDRSHANIVLRHLRMSGQVASLDTNIIA